jgi:metal-responsive CopG/Arc/MetJ family transcriptional regulator
MAKTAIKLELDDELLDELDRRRGKGTSNEVPRVRVIRAALEVYLADGHGHQRPVSSEHAEHVRSSFEAKAGVVPIAKGK